MFASSSGASTSSSTQKGLGFALNMAKSNAIAVMACSPPERSEMLWGFLARRPCFNLDARFEGIVFH